MKWDAEKYDRVNIQQFESGMELVRLADVTRYLNDKIESELVKVPFEFQAGSNKMMIVKPKNGS